MDTSDKPAHDQRIPSTLLFCRSHDDGTISPDWSSSREEELRGQFEEGLTVADRYLLKNKLGDGSMGRVFLATDLRLERPVAMKVVSHPRVRFKQLDLSLEREAKLGANLNHRGIAAVYDFGFHDNKSFTIFEYVEGETLRELISRRGSIPLKETLHIARDLAAALDFAHMRGVVHRDLKPENICFTKGGECKILDLGMAHDIRSDLSTRVYSGTPAYSSPEQAECRLTDGKSDQYALGLIVFEMLTGRRAFVDAEPRRLLRQQVETEPPRLRETHSDLPESAENAVARALSKAPGARFATCREFASELGAEIAEPAGRHIVPTPTENRIGFYLAHVAEESLLARQMSEMLEQEQYACWYYGRDAIPGVPFASQSRAAIERSQAVVVLFRARPCDWQTLKERLSTRTGSAVLFCRCWSMFLARNSRNSLRPGASCSARHHRLNTVARIPYGMSSTEWLWPQNRWIFKSMRSWRSRRPNASASAPVRSGRRTPTRLTLWIWTACCSGTIRLTIS